MMTNSGSYGETCVNPDRQTEQVAVDGMPAPLETPISECQPHMVLSVQLSERLVLNVQPYIN